MAQRIRSAAMLICALLLVLPASVSMADEQRSEDNALLGVKAPSGARIIPPPDLLPQNGTGEPGDDDTPNRDGLGGLGPPTRDTVTAVSEGRKYWSMRDWVAWLRLHAFNVMRARR